MKITDIAIEADLDPEKVANALFSCSIQEQTRFLNQYLGAMGLRADAGDLAFLRQNLTITVKEMMRKIV